MTGRKMGHEVEIWFGLGDGDPFLMGGGTVEDAVKASSEGDCINATTKDFGPADQMSPGARHFYEELGRTAGVSPQTEEAIETYEDGIDKSREEFLSRMKGTSEEGSTE